MCGVNRLAGAAEADCEKMYGMSAERSAGYGKAYKTMTSSSVMNITLGIIMIVAGLASGIITIVNGARLLKDRHGITF